MAITIPEQILYRVVSGMLIHLKKDYDDATNKDTTLLARLFKDEKNVKFDYYREAISLFTRNTDHPRKINVNLFYRAERTNMPTIHVVLMSDTTGENDLSMGETGFLEDHYIDEGQGTITPTYARRFNSQYMIVCTSESEEECLLMYRTVQALLISIADTLELHGLQNIKFSGQELRINPELVPQNIFSRGVTISALHEVRVPRLFTSAVINDIITQGTIVVN